MTELCLICKGQVPTSTRVQPCEGCGRIAGRRKTMSNRYTLQIENAELEKQLKNHKRLLFKVNKELDLYKNRGYSARKVRVDAIREMVKKVKHISLLGGFVALRLDHILEYADEQEKDDG